MNSKFINIFVPSFGFKPSDFRQSACSKASNYQPVIKKSNKEKKKPSLMSYVVTLKHHRLMIKNINLANLICSLENFLATCATKKKVRNSKIKIICCLKKNYRSVTIK